MCNCKSSKTSKKVSQKELNRRIKKAEKRLQFLEETLKEKTDKIVSDIDNMLIFND